MLLAPRPKRLLQLIFLPIDEHFLHLALLLTRVARVFKPSEEAATKLHLSHADHVVSQDLLRQVLALGDDRSFAGLGRLNFSSLVRDLEVLFFNLLSHTVSLFHESHVDLSSLGILPLLECHATLIPG